MLKPFLKQITNMEREEFEDSSILAEIAGRAITVTPEQRFFQFERLEFWDKFIEDVSVRLMEERKEYRIYNPKDVVGK